MPTVRQKLSSFRILLVAIPLVLILIGYFGYWIVNRTSEQIIVRQAERIAVSWAIDFGSRLSRIEEIVVGGEITPSDAVFIERAGGLGDVFLLKLFDNGGKLVLEANENEINVFTNQNLKDHNEKAARVLAEGKPFTSINDGSEKPNRPDVYVESYAPILRHGKTVAIVEVYIDQTDAAAIVRTDFARFGLKTAGLVLLALSIPAIALLRTSWLLGQRNRALQIERERASIAEKRLLQAQRMEAIGQLTGGVAHDFNNLLAVIIGNAELLEDRLGDKDETLNAIFRAVTRGAELTQRLLAFSRQQPLRPQTFNLDTLVSDMSAMLARTLGEAVTVETKAAPNMWQTTADPGQVENALLNLTINARDAMSGGGRLTIECDNIHVDDTFVGDNPGASIGDYVVLTVRDEGCGMTSEVQARAFESFFTTKDVGEGSGLGLSMVYGFAKQSNGYATIDSEPDRGTAVKLFLPRSVEEIPQPAAPTNENTPQGRGQTILMIEDNPDVRTLCRKLLLDLGYKVIDVPDAAAAQVALEEEAPVDLVLSDVVLPGGTSGPEFAQTVRQTHPDLKIVFMSGYPAEAANRNDIVSPDEVLLNKPFQRKQLAFALHEALNQERATV